MDELYYSKIIFWYKETFEYFINLLPINLQFLHLKQQLYEHEK